MATSNGRIMVNRTPVLTLWAAVVAERLGYDPALALTLGKAVSGLYAQIRVRDDQVDGEELVRLLGRIVSLARTENGLRARNQGRLIDPAKVTRYLEGKFGDNLPVVRQALAALAASYPCDRLADCAYALYLRFKPQVPPGWAGWGAAGMLDLEVVWELTL
jgi:hypothetical protein